MIYFLSGVVFIKTIFYTDFLHLILIFHQYVDKTPK